VSHLDLPRPLSPHRAPGYFRQRTHLLCRSAAEAIIAAHFGIELLAGLVRAGLVSVALEVAQAGGQRIEVVRMKITEAGAAGVG
jgi:hypothetical protein